MDHLVYYSQVSTLAFKINQLYYEGIHYVWCTDQPLHKNAEQQAASSDPVSRCEDYLKAIKTNDKHSLYIEQNKASIKKGAEDKRGKKQISQETFDEIIVAVNTARIEDFYPLLYVIPYEKVKNLIHPADKKEKANETSKEFKIEKLPRECFDVIEIQKLLPNNWIDRGDII